MQMILPATNPILRARVTQLQQCQLTVYGQYISGTPSKMITYHLMEIIRHEIELQIELERLKVKYYEAGATMKEGFKQIAGLHIKFSNTELARFLKRWGADTSLSPAVLRRFDQEGSGLVSIHQFLFVMGYDEDKEWLDDINLEVEK